MSEKKNSLEEKRILQKKLQWYTLEAEDGEFNAILPKICRGKCGKLSKKKRADVEIRSLLF